MTDGDLSLKVNQLRLRHCGIAERQIQDWKHAHQISYPEFERIMQWARLWFSVGSPLTYELSSEMHLIRKEANCHNEVNKVNQLFDIEFC